MILLIGFTVIMAVGVGWSIGANDAANSMGTAVGSRVLTLRQAIILIVIFGFLGALLQGAHVAKTIGKGIVPLDSLERTTAVYIALVASFAACAWVVLATYWKMPISTSHSIVGAVAGAGLAIGAPVRWKVLLDIFMCWIFTPLGAAILGYIFYKVFKSIFYRIIPRRYIKLIMSILIILSGCYVAFSWGANDVANAVGVISGANIFSPTISVLIGGAAIVLGIVTWGYKVIETIGSEITHLLPLMAFSAQLASAINVHIYTLFGIPVSTSHSIVGAIFGVGLVKGVRVVNLRILREIVLCWLATPFISGIISFLVLRTLRFAVKL
ncbi:MAG: anion permease [Candidatus Omnitrophota bacterium]|nr:MAG: anion permease [Candidatus Omnitrophota bacterium]